MKVSYDKKYITLRFEEDDLEIAARTLRRLFGSRRGDLMLQQILEARRKHDATHVN